MTKTPERLQFLTDVLTTAVEGGIQYWADVHEYKWDVPLGEAYVVVQDKEDESSGLHRVTLDTIAKGIGVLNKTAPREGYWAEFWIANRTNSDEGDYDAGIADCILQAGIFGEVVYG